MYRKEIDGTDDDEIRAHGRKRRQRDGRRNDEDNDGNARRRKSRKLGVRTAEKKMTNSRRTRSSSVIRPSVRPSVARVAYVAAHKVLGSSVLGDGMGTRVFTKGVINQKVSEPRYAHVYLRAYTYAKTSTYRTVRFLRPTVV